MSIRMGRIALAVPLPLATTASVLLEWAGTSSIVPDVSLTVLVGVLVVLSWLIVLGECVKNLM
jgi:hypothetical protein